MSVDIEKKLMTGVKVVALSGLIGTGFSLNALHQDIEKNVPEKIISPDGHSGSKLTDKQGLLVLAGAGSLTLSSVAFAFGHILKEEEKKKTMQAAMMAAKQKTK